MNSNNRVKSIYERCFVFSRLQKQELLNTEKNIAIGKFKLGTVVVNGVSKEYTEMVTDFSKARYGDAVLVAKGDIRKMSFTEPSR